MARKGEDFINQKFEELSDLRDISRCIKGITGIDCVEQDQFGLERIATLPMIRKTWIANKEFKIVLATVDSGHTVGEVELQQRKTFKVRGGSSIEQKKQSAMLQIDNMTGKSMEQS
ncbi:hypothetical protein K469DRAFT_802636 [Zopfia rhizophila CBS 207.26]|uniref:Uncharacterized protein n=1 Tax=Zopfia rhizophila CBS 207.26 TaxID=1314779 RepID=A0A6A6DK09_9PEZI|nr:hypothetical protein K469DRAFT_802636 [Zopfia rhizophila CBS 207.26]